MTFIENYSDLISLKPPTIRARLRDVVLEGLTLWNRLGGGEELLRTPRIQFIYLHHIFNDEVAKLEILLIKLSKIHTFISYSEAVEKIISGNIDKPYICFSTDDGFKNNLNSVELFAKFGIKACFFINPSIIDVKDNKRIKDFCRNRLNLPSVEFLTWSDVDRLLELGHEIGSHTMDHADVKKMSLESFRQDCKETMNYLKPRVGLIGIHFAFPYGRFSNFSKEAEQIVFESGFSSCATAERGCHINVPGGISRTKLCIRRDHLILDWNPDHLDYFMCKNIKSANFNTNIFLD